MAFPLFLSAAKVSSDGPPYDGHQWQKNKEEYTQVERAARLPETIPFVVPYGAETYYITSPRLGLFFCTFPVFRCKLSDMVV